MNNNKIPRTNIITLISGLLLFVFSAYVAVSGISNPVDDYILISLRNPGSMLMPLGPEWLTVAMRDISVMGDVTFVTLITVFTAILLILKKNYLHLKLILFAVIGGGLLETTFKALFSRPRPQVVPHLVDVYSLSFPSGHSTISAVIYLALVYLIFNSDFERKIKYYFLYSAIILILLIGFSRIYLGVHYPSDVIGGWGLGIAWISFCLILFNKLKKNSTA